MNAGPTPKPTALRLLEGDRRKGKNPINRREPQPKKLANLDPPAWLSEEARKIWDQLAPEFDAVGLLRTVDAMKFGHYCEDIVESIILRKRVREEGWVTVGTNKKDQEYEMTNGLVAVFNNLMARLDKFGQQFGDSPASRVRLDSGEEMEQGGLMAFIGKKAG